MSTGQFPKRRETDEQAKRRADRLREKEQERWENGLPLKAMPEPPRISASGRLAA